MTVVRFLVSLFCTLLLIEIPSSIDALYRYIYLQIYLNLWIPPLKLHIEMIDLTNDKFVMYYL